MAQVTESDYIEAQNGDARVKQQFCDALDLGEHGITLGARYYFDRGGHSMGYAPKRNALFFYPNDFLDSYEMFLSSSTKHEPIHIGQVNERWEIFDQLMGDISLLRNKDWLPVLELPAMANQIAHFSRIRFEEEVVYERYARLLSQFKESKSKPKLRDYMEAILLGTPGDELIWRDILSK